MDKDSAKVKRLIVILFISCLCIAFVCFGISAYQVVTARNAGTVTSWFANMTKAVALIGIFFLVIAFGYLLPILISGNKKKKGNSGGYGIFDETKMRLALEKYIPTGETLLAGIHAAANETSVDFVFAGGVRMEDRLHPDENGGIVAISKKKYSGYDIYIGITQKYLVMADCELYRYYYQFDDEPNEIRDEDIRYVTEDILFSDIGRRFSFTDIKSCEIKKGWPGSVKCFITMKNGSYFKLMFPKLGGLGGGMPHHAQYRDAIISRLSEIQ